MERRRKLIPRRDRRARGTSRPPTGRPFAGAQSRRPPPRIR
ncbi:MAG: hypothetical protein ACRD0D_14210 [Acidimicrobiales bacterium]